MTKNYEILDSTEYSGNMIRMNFQNSEKWAVGDFDDVCKIKDRWHTSFIGHQQCWSNMSNLSTK